MGKVMLAVVMVPPLLVLREHLRPGTCLGEAMVGHPPLYREQGLGVILPGLARLNAFFADAQHIVELHGLIAVEDATAIGHDRFWRAVAPQGICQD